MLESQESVQLLYSSSLTCFILEVRTCYSKKSPFSQCGGNPWQSRESLSKQGLVIPSQQAALFADWKRTHTLPHWCQHLNLEDQVECRIRQGLWEQEGESQPENPSSHLLLSPPVACKMLLFQPLFSVSLVRKKEQLENTFLKAVVK